MKYHYWINKIIKSKNDTNIKGIGTDGKSNTEEIMSLYNLHDKGVDVKVKKCIYTTTDTKITNRNIRLTENLVVSEMDIYEDFKMVNISDKCRFLYNDKVTILEMDGKNMNTACDIFFSLVDTTEDNILFIVDDEDIK